MSLIDNNNNNTPATTSTPPSGTSGVVNGTSTPKAPSPVPGNVVSGEQPPKVNTNDVTNPSAPTPPPQQKPPSASTSPQPQLPTSQPQSRPQSQPKSQPTLPQTAQPDGTQTQAPAVQPEVQQQPSEIPVPQLIDEQQPQSQSQSQSQPQPQPVQRTPSSQSHRTESRASQRTPGSRGRVSRTSVVIQTASQSPSPPTKPPSTTGSPVPSNAPENTSDTATGEQQQPSSGLSQDSTIPLINWFKMRVSTGLPGGAKLKWEQLHIAAVEAFLQGENAGIITSHKILNKIGEDVSSTPSSPILVFYSSEAAGLCVQSHPVPSESARALVYFLRPVSTIPPGHKILAIKELSEKVVWGVLRQNAVESLLSMMTKFYAPVMEHTAARWPES